MPRRWRETLGEEMTGDRVNVSTMTRWSRWRDRRRRRRQDDRSSSSSTLQDQSIKRKVIAKIEGRGVYKGNEKEEKQ
jgi:hypothetical protein